MTVLVPPRADPNIACAVEWFSLSNTIGGTRQVMTATVTLDQAPGAGKTDTIVFTGGLIGIPAR